MNRPDIGSTVATCESTSGSEVPSLLQAMDAIACDDAPDFDTSRLQGALRIVDFGAPPFEVTDA
jgi:hypothetical protein